MTQAEKKALAQEIVGDGNTPNKFFVTTSPYIYESVDFGQLETELLDGFSSEDYETEVFDTYEEAKSYYDQVDLDASFGIGAGIVIIEDRLTGTICERYLQKRVEITYDELERNDAKRFGYE